MDPQWLGPYTVKSDLGKGFYSLESLQDGSKVERINGAHLKVYISSPVSNHHQLSSGNSTVSDMAWLSCLGFIISL